MLKYAAFIHNYCLSRTATDCMAQMAYDDIYAVSSGIYLKSEQRWNVSEIKSDIALIALKVVHKECTGGFWWYNRLRFANTSFAPICNASYPTTIMIIEVPASSQV